MFLFLGRTLKRKSKETDRQTDRQTERKTLKSGGSQSLTYHHLLVSRERKPQEKKKKSDEARTEKRRAHQHHVLNFRTTCRKLKRPKESCEWTRPDLNKYQGDPTALVCLLSSQLYSSPPFLMSVTLVSLVSLFSLLLPTVTSQSFSPCSTINTHVFLCIQGYRKKEGTRKERDRESR